VSDNRRAIGRKCAELKMVLKTGIFWDVMLCGSCKNDVSEELNASIIRVTRIGELGTIIAVTNNRHTL
jgi:hypothetical protein